MSDVARRVRVARNIMRTSQPGMPWIVRCDWCSCDWYSSDWLVSFFAESHRWGAADWQTAQDFAQSHAVEHEATRCVTCHHVPLEVPADERVKA